LIWVGKRNRALGLQEATQCSLAKPNRKHMSNKTQQNIASKELEQIPLLATMRKAIPLCFLVATL